MKITSLILLLTCSLAHPALATTVEVNWEPVIHDEEGLPKNASHYLLYFGQTPRPASVVHPADGNFSYDNITHVGNVTRVRQRNLEPGKSYYFSVAAVDLDGNISNYSKEVRITLPAQSDGGVTRGNFDGGWKPPGQPSNRAASDGAAKGSGKTEAGCGCHTRGSPAAWFLVCLLLGGYAACRRKTT